MYLTIYAVPNNVFLADCAQKLILHLQKQKEWFPQPKWGSSATAQFLLGFGTGANVLLQFATSNIHHPSLASLHGSTCTLILVNAFAHIGDGIKKKLQTLLKTMKQGNPSEHVEHIVSILFADAYLTKASKPEILSRFFSLRQNLLNKNGLIWLRWLLKGVLKNEDLTECLGRITLPQIYIHATENQLVAPSHMTVFETASGWQNVAETSQCFQKLDNDDLPVHISWLKGGHELLQERQSFFVDLIKRLVQEFHQLDLNPLKTKPVLPPSPQKVVQVLEKPPPELEHHVINMDADDEDEVFNDHSNDIEQVVEETESFCDELLQLVATKGIQGVQYALAERNINELGSDEKLKVILNRELIREQKEREANELEKQKEIARAEAQEAKRQRRMAQKKAQIERQEERARAEETARRKREAELLRQDQEKIALEKRRQKEIQDMVDADAYSAMFEAYEKQQEEWREKAIRNKEKIQELEDERQEEREKAAAQEATMERAREIERRRTELEAYRDQMDASSLVLEGDDTGYGLEDGDDILAMVEGSGKFQRDYILVKTRVTDTEEQLMASKRKYSGYEAIRERFELKLRNVRRAITLAEKEGKFVKVDVGNVRKVPITPAMRSSLKKDKLEAETGVNDTTALMNMTSQEISVANQALQRLYGLQKRVEAILDAFVSQLEEKKLDASDLVHQLREEKNQCYSESRLLEQKVEKWERRLAVITAELDRVKPLKGRMIDTDAWIEGTRQRLEKKTLIKNLSTEASTLQNQMENLQQKSKDLTEMAQEKDRQYIEHSNRAEKLLEQEELLIALRNRLNDEKAARFKNLRKKSSKTTPEDENSDANESDSDDDDMEIADRIRQKSSMKRTLEEKQWVALDSRICLSNYDKVPEREMEEMKFDKDYQTDLLKQDLNRILTLPARIELALPFLKSQAEVKAHELLRKYTFGDGEEEFKSRDREFSGHPIKSSAILLNSISEILPEHRDAKIFINRNKSKGLIEMKDRVLKARESQTIPFNIPDDAPAISISVSIVFKGTFGVKGYKVGRLAATMYYISPQENKPAAQIGLASYADIELCTARNFGKIHIVHKPNTIPLCMKGTYQVVIGAPADTSYSLSITLQLASRDSLVVAEARGDAIEISNRLPENQTETTELLESMRLTERKLRLARSAAQDAQACAEKVEKKMIELTQKLEDDDVELELDDHGRLKLLQQVRAAERAFSRQCRHLATRQEEAEDIKAGLERMAYEHRRLNEERQKLEKQFEFYRKHLPKATGIIRGDKFGYQVADEVDGIYEAPVKKNYWARLSALRSKLPAMMTPAQRLRRKYARGRTEDLTSSERQWLILDLMIHPEKYPSHDDKTTDDKITSQVFASSTKHRSNSFKFKLYKAEERLAAFSANEIQRILQADWNSLERREIVVRKTLAQYSDVVNESEKRRVQKLKNMNKKRKSQTKYQKIRFEERSSVVETDIDLKCRSILREIDRALANSNETMDSAVLHGNLQRFPTKVLRLELEKELDRILLDQIRERERAPNVIDQSSDVSSESDQDEEAVLIRKQQAAVKKAGPVSHIKQREIRREEMKNKSVQYRQRKMIQEELGEGGCIACCTNPCQWTTYLNESVALERVEAVQGELDRIKRIQDDVVTSHVCLTSLRAGVRPMKRSDAFDELTREQKNWDLHLRLHYVDEELHACHISNEEQFQTKSLHGFTQVQFTDNAKLALEREHSRLSAHVTAYEIVQDILEGMLEGWVFGERQSERKVLGFIPSIKRSGPLTFSDLRRMDKENADEKTAQEAKEQARKEKITEQYGTPLEKWVPIEEQAQQVKTNAKAVKEGGKIDHVLNETENALKFGLFSLTLMYFRGLSMLKKQKDTWSGANDAMTLHKQPEKISAERLKIRDEERKRLVRQKRIHQYDGMIAAVRDRQKSQKDDELYRLKQRLWEETRQTKREGKAALIIQRIYRGHMGRKAARKWKLRRAEIEAENALMYVSAVTLQRAYRGRLGRVAAEEQRLEIAEFISQIRAQEAIDEEETYWKTHRFQRFKRRLTGLR